MAVGFPTKANWAAGDVLTASAMDDLAGTVNTVQYLKPWNQVLNSNMSVWQRGTSISATASNAYTADRWQLAANTGQTCTVSRQVTGDTTNLPFIQYCARVQRNSGQTATGVIGFGQSFESVNSIPYVGKQITLSFYARAGANYSAVSNYVLASLYSGTGTDQNVLVYYTGSTAVVSNSSLALTTTWQRFTLTGTVGSTATELGIYFNYTPVGTAGANDYFEITGVQLEQGSVANTYQPNQATYQGELAACQRYFEKSFDVGVFPMSGSTVAGLRVADQAASSTGTVGTWVGFKTTKRSTPTVTLYRRDGSSTNANYWIWTTPGGSVNYAAFSVYSPSTNGFTVYPNSVSGETAGYAVILEGHFTADAEL
jgi:hypothetical protein